MDELNTKRLTLREWQISDAADLFEYAKAPEVGPMAGWRPHISVDDSRRIIETNFSKAEDWAVVLNESGKVIGSISLMFLRDISPAGSTLKNARELGYAMGRDYWGKGYMTEAVRVVLAYAFDVLALDSVEVSHSKDNIRSKRVIEKAGFKWTGRVQRKLSDGTVKETVTYALSREAYFEKK